MSSSEANVLGKQIPYPKTYCPEILVAVPRSLNREVYGITRPDELFCGYDNWHAYEASFLLDNGMPVSGILKIVYPSTSPYIVESKSLKLYLGSYHMTPMGKKHTDGIHRYTQQIEKDLSRLLETPVATCFYSSLPEQAPFDFEDYTILEDSLASEAIPFSVYRECPDLLDEQVCETGGELKVGSHLLKSNCKITGQPDWGSIYIHLKGQTLPDRKALLKYIVSLRNENHFHEEICEMTYKRLWDRFHPEILTVNCLYTRRGGIDICPVRSNRPEFLPQNIRRVDVWTRRGFRQ